MQFHRALVFKESIFQVTLPLTKLKSVLNDS